jgi:hypothetical protein
VGGASPVPLTVLDCFWQAMASGAGLLLLLVLCVFLHVLAFMPAGSRRAWEPRGRACVRRYTTPDPADDTKSIESLLGKGKGVLGWSFTC